MLLNARELFHYSAVASDGPAGAVRDLLVDDKNWSVRHIVVDTEGLLSDNHVVLSSTLVKGVRPLDQELEFALSKSEMADSSPASLSPPVSAHHNEPETLAGAEHDPHLRSAVEIGEYTVFASDGELGRAHGLVVEAATWRVRYLVVDTGELLSSQQVLLAPIAIRDIDWDSRKVTTNLTVNAVHECPVYDRESEITRQYEAFLHSYYGWHPYWQAD